MADFRSLYTNPVMTGSAAGTRSYDWGNGVTYTLSPVTIWTSSGSFTNYTQSWTQSAPAPAPAAAVASATPVIGPVLDNNVSVSVYGKVIPISAGLRRVPGDLLWLEDDQLNTEGEYTAHVAYGFGYRLMEDATAVLAKLWGNGTVLYDISTGFIADGFVLEAEYDGSQTTADPEIAADRGADITPAFKQQLYIRCTLPTKEFGGTLPNISALWADGSATDYLPWGGTWDPLNKATAIVLTDDDMTATSPGAAAYDAVRSTVSHSEGRRYFEFEINAHGSSHVIGSSLYRWGFTDETSLVNYDDHLLGSFTSGTFGHTIFDGSISNAGLGAGSGFNSLGALTTGQRYGVAFDLDIPGYWITNDGVSWYGPTGLGLGDPAAGTDSQTEVGYHGFTEYYIAWSGYDAGDSITIWTDEGLLFGGPGEVTALTLTEVILAVARRCGLSIGDFDFVGLDDIFVTGIVITTTTDFRAFLQNAGRTYGFDYTESGGRILVKKAVIASTYTLDFTIGDYELVPLSDEAAVQTTRANTVDYPTVFEFSYQDETIDFQPSMQRARREEARVMRTDSFAVPFVMNATEALTGATTALYREWQQRTQHSLKTAFRYLNLEPTDLIQFTVDDVTYTAKVTNTVRNSDLSVSISGVNLLTVEADLRTIDGEYQGGEYAGEGYSGEPNISNEPMEVPIIPPEATPIGLLLALTYTTPP